MKSIVRFACAALLLLALRAQALTLMPGTAGEVPGAPPLPGVAHPAGDDALRALDERIEKEQFREANEQAAALEEKRPQDAALLYRRIRILKEMRLWREAEELGLRAIPLAEATEDKRFLFDVLDEYAEVLWLDEKVDLTADNLRDMAKYRALRPATRMVALAADIGDDELLWRAFVRRGFSHRVESDGAKFRFGEAANYMRQCIALAERNGWPEKVREGKVYLAHFLACMFRFADAMKIYNELGLPPHTRIMLVTGQWQGLYEVNRQNIIDCERRMAAMTTEEEKLRAVGWHERKMYDFFATACTRLGRWDEAFEASERLNSYGLRDLLASDGEAIRRRKAEAVAASEGDASSRVRALETRRATPGDGGVQRDLALQAGALEELRADDGRTREEIESLSSGRSVTAGEIQALLDDDTALLVFHTLWADLCDGGYICALTKEEVGGARVRALQISAFSRDSEIERAVHAYRDALQRSIRAGGAPAADVNTLSRALYDLLITPVYPALQGKKRVIIVPTGPLARLPFHLLRAPDGRYLGETHTVSYAQSATVLKSCLARDRRAAPPVLALANPALREAGYSLKFAEDEAAEIVKLHPDTRAFMGAEATVEAFRREAGTAGIIHFACHGFQDDRHPMESFLALAPGEGDGRLTTRQVFDIDTRAGLVVLSACDTGEGRLSPGQTELLGMTRAWMFAGAPSVIASLWKLDDRSTSELMAEFYKNLKTMGRAEALQRAQMEMMKRYENPYYWGAFVLYGDYR